MKGNWKFHLTVLPMHFESNYHWPKSQFVKDYLDLDFMQNKTVNNDVNMKINQKKTVCEKREFLMAVLPMILETN